LLRFTLFRPAVLAVHVKESNCIYATTQSSETNTFCEKLRREKYSEFSKRCRKYIFKYNLEVAKGDKKMVFDSISRHQRDRQQHERIRKLVWTTSALMLPTCLR